MPLSSVTRVSDGIQKQYDFDFGYLRKSHVFVFVNNELQSFKWLGPFQIELLNFPQPDDTVTIRRLTDRVNRITTFTDGQTILAEDLNAADLQTFYIAQEMLDQIEERILAGEVSVIGSGYITAQWIQEQLAANIAGSAQFQAVSDAIDNEALERANALAAEAAARAAEIAAEAAARGAAVFDLEQADLEAGQRLDVLEAVVDDPDTGIKARLGTLETVTVDLENNKADASVVSAIQAAVYAAEAQITTIDEALATETAVRTSQIAAASSRLDGAEASLTSLGITVTNLATNKAEASELSALAARVGAAEADIITESSARASGDIANATTIEQNRAAVDYQQNFPNLCVDADISGQWGAHWIAGSDRDYPGQVARFQRNLANWYVPGVRTVYFETLANANTTEGASWASIRKANGARVPVYPGDTVYFGKKVAGHRLRGAFLNIFWFDAAGNIIASDAVYKGSTAKFDFGAIGGAAENFELMEYVGVAPAGAVSADMIVWFVTKGGEDNPFGWWTEPVIAKVPSGFSGTVPWSKQSSSVSFLREALATGSTSLARLLLAVNTTNNVATIEAVAAEGEGVWNGSAITLQANLIKLLAQDIQFGSRTQFEDGRGTLYNVEGGKRLRILGPFGASNDLVIWYGANSIALQSETRSNCDFALSTDGKLHLESRSLTEAVRRPAASNAVYTGLTGSNRTTSASSITLNGVPTPTKYLWYCPDPNVVVTAKNGASSAFRLPTMGGDYEAPISCTMETADGVYVANAIARWVATN